jgi:hypothetical protein
VGRGGGGAEVALCRVQDRAPVERLPAGPEGERSLRELPLQPSSRPLAGREKIITIGGGEKKKKKLSSAGIRLLSKPGIDTCSD